MTKGPLSTDPPVTTVTRVAYWPEAVGTRFALHRFLCRGSSTVVSDTLVAHDLTVEPSIGCDVTCSGSGTAVPSTITMTLVSKDLLSRLGPVTVTLTGQRRQT